MIPYREVRKLALKPDEAIKPVYARVVTHSVSTFLVWLLQGLPLTPNIITLASLASALASLPFFVLMTPRSVLTGALLIELYYVFDAMDGQWARFKNQKSLTGAFFDYSINYIIQTPLVFAIGWGVWSVTGNVRFLILGFLGGLSTLWIILIWNLRAAVLLSHLTRLGKAPRTPPAPEAPDPYRPAPPLDARKLFYSSVHKTLVFPWFMNVLTGASALTVVYAIAGLYAAPPIFAVFTAYYGIVGTAAAAVITAHWILTGKIDKAPEIA